MRIITKREVIQGVAARWKEQYWSARKGFDGSGREKMYQSLIALPDTATEADVSKIIGNDSWTANKCGECRKDAPVLVHVGEEPDYESNTFYLCGACLLKAVALLDESVTT